MDVLLKVQSVMIYIREKGMLPNLLSPSVAINTVRKPLFLVTKIFADPLNLQVQGYEHDCL